MRQGERPWGGGGGHWVFSVDLPGFLVEGGKGGPAAPSSSENGAETIRLAWLLSKSHRALVLDSSLLLKILDLRYHAHF